MAGDCACRAGVHRRGILCGVLLVGRPRRHSNIAARESFGHDAALHDLYLPGREASATLQALLHFRWPAISPALLNVCWLAAIWGIAPSFAPDKLAQAHVIAAAIVVSGVLQFAVQLPALRALGFRFDYNWQASRDAFWQVGRAMLPITLGMAVTQINTLLDSLIAWGLSAEAGASQTIHWLGDAVYYPMQTGAAASVYYGERFYQFPVGVLGLAIATVVYPLVSRHAARGDTAPDRRRLDAWTTTRVVHGPAGRHWHAAAG